MSNASSLGTTRAETVEPTARGSLLRTEVLRLRSRRMVRVLLGLGVLAFVAGILIASTQYAKPSAAGLARAIDRRAQVVADSERNRQQCLSSVGTPQGPPTKDQCGPPLRPEDVGGVENFIDKRPFTLGQQGRAGVLGVSAAVAGLAFLIGATYVGAEWSTRSMVALLFWEPRRRRVMVSKLTVLVTATAALGLLGEAAWLFAARGLAASRGITAVPHGLWGQLIGSAARGVLLVVLFALLGFGIANLVRNTAAALGVGFVYFAVLENVLRVIRPHWQPWLVTDNAVALITHGGLRLAFNEGFVDGRGIYQATGHEVVVSNVHGALVLGVVTAVVAVLGVVLFTRRDLN